MYIVGRQKRWTTLHHAEPEKSAYHIHHHLAKHNSAKIHNAILTVPVGAWRFSGAPLVSCEFVGGEVDNLGLRATFEVLPGYFAFPHQSDGRTWNSLNNCTATMDLRGSNKSINIPENDHFDQSTSRSFREPTHIPMNRLILDMQRPTG